MAGLCTICRLPRANHQYPYPTRNHLFTEQPQQETKPMVEEEATNESSEPKRRKKKPEPQPCAVCGRRQHVGRWGPYDHEYEPMTEKQIAARAATQGGGTEAEDNGDGNGKPRRGRPRKAGPKPTADDLRRKRTKQSLASKRIDRKDRILGIATRVVQLQAQLADATAELEAMLE